ncbi:hypothetical protein PM082_019298 [Marasmius tenuissimus]|nr:hypothetical protein PM082_019298 [Marasmius tenuissimus]
MGSEWFSSGKDTRTILIEAHRCHVSDSSVDSDGIAWAVVLEPPAAIHGLGSNAGIHPGKNTVERRAKTQRDPLSRVCKRRPCGDLGMAGGPQR